MTFKVVYLMRGLPSSGKSHRARQLAGGDGALIESDAYLERFREELLESDKTDEEILGEARRWSFQQFCEAISRSQAPIVVDRGNGLTLESFRYVQHAHTNGYSVELVEPDSEWWQEIRVLLKYKDVTRPILDQWAIQLAEWNADTHGVTADRIRLLMDAWQPNLTIEDILRFGEKAKEDRWSISKTNDRTD